MRECRQVCLLKKMQQSATERGIEISIQAKSMTEAKKEYP